MDHGGVDWAGSLYPRRGPEIRSYCESLGAACHGACAVPPGGLPSAPRDAAYILNLTPVRCQAG
jgi:hypothetical protein